MSISDPIITSVLCGMLIERVQYLLAVVGNSLGLLASECCDKDEPCGRHYQNQLGLICEIFYNNIHISYTYGWH